ncbi:MAG: hypothetical protein ACYC6L_06625 [Anaerolineae bacterium]
MRLRNLSLGLWLAALMLWLGLLYLMNRTAPDAGAQALFLVLFGAAVTCTLAPIFLAMRPPRSQAQTVLRLISAVSHAALFGALAIALMTLQFLRLLNITTAVLLTVVVLLLEFLLSLRRHA